MKKVKDFWTIDDCGTELAKAAFIYGEVCGLADTWIEDYCTDDSDYDVDMDDLFFDYLAECFDEFKNSDYYIDAEWDYADDEKYIGNGSFEEFISNMKEGK